jgi:hypothetical protein
MSVARIYRVASQYNATELVEVSIAQSANTMYLAHLNHEPGKLVRNAHIDWTFSTVAFSPTIAAPTGVVATASSPNTDAANSGDAYFPQPASYVVTALTDAQESRASSESTCTNDLTLKRNSNTIAWSAVTGATRYHVYKADNTQEFGYIGTTTDLSFVDDNIGPDYSDGPPQGQNPFTGSDDHPSTVTFHEQRLLLARTNNHPNAAYGSRSGDFENADTSRPLKASDAFQFAIVSGRVNAINSLISMNTLLAVTSDSIFKIDGGQAGYISPTDFVVRRQNGRGGSRLAPLVIDNVAFYQTSVGNSIRTVGYEFSSDSFNSNDITIYSPHLFRGFNIVSWTYLAEPRSLIVAVRDDGKMLCFTWEQEQQVWGWTVWETDGVVKSVATISESGEDRLYLTVQRNGKLLIERMAAANWSGVENTCFLDSAVTYIFETPQTELRNLDHLEGLTISAIADGAVVSGLVVSGGVVNLPYAASTVSAGLPYSATVETLPLAMQTAGKGWTLATPQTQGKAVVRVVNTRGLKAGPNSDNLEELRARVNELPGDPADLQTGLLETFLLPEINGGAKVVLVSDDPLPCTITGIFIDPTP